MSAKNPNLVPKSTGPKTLDFVWAYDTEAHIVDLSGATVIKKINANDARNTTKLTKKLDEEGNWTTGLWTDALGNIYKNDICGNDISGSLYSKAFYVSDGTGLKTLTKIAGNGINANQYSFVVGDLINTLFTDQKGTGYLTSYNSTITAGARLPADLSLSVITPPGVRSDVSTNHFNGSWTDNSNNKITIDCAAFISGSDVSFNPVDVDLSLNFRMTRSAIATVTDVSNQLLVNMYKMGVSPISSIIKVSDAIVQNTWIDLSINVLNTGSTLVVDTSGAAISAAENDNLRPNFDLINFLVAPAPFTKSGRQNVRFPITINPGVFGQWTWSVYLQDGNMKSSATDINLKIMPSFSEPIVTVTGETTLYKDDEYKVNLKVADNNFNSDICNNATRGLMLIPRFNAVGDNLIGADNSANLINRALKVSYDTSLSAFVDRTLLVSDLCLNTLTFADVSNSYVNVFGGNRGLVVRPQDISLNADDTYSKVRDISTNIIIKNNDDISQCHLPSRSFDMFVDWLPSAQSISSSVVKPQTLSIGRFNVATNYSSNVILTNNKDGTYSLSLSDYDGKLSGANYRVKVFTTDKCITEGVASNVTLDTQPNVDKISTVDFRVQFDSANNATFTGPKLVANAAHKTYFMVAYLEVDSVTYLYTASNKVGFTETNWPLLDLRFDVVNSFTAADLNKIVNIDENLDLNKDLADLSGYAIRSVNFGPDLSCNLRLPEWSINNPTITFTLNDTNNVVKSFDISANDSKASSINNQIVFNNVKDVSNNGLFTIDLSYNTTNETNCLFSMDITFSDSDNTDYSKTNKTVQFYFMGNYSGNNSTNVGNKKNTLVVYNDTKYIIDNKTDLTQMTLGSIDGYNCYSWLAGTASNSYVLNLARSEFVGADHVLDISAFKIDSTSWQSDSSANLYLGFNGDWTGVSTVTVGNSVNGVITSFARNTFSWIDTKKFVGTIDINYSTKNAKGKSDTVNKLRLVVVPRPNLTLNVALTPNVLVNTKANITATVTNTALNRAGDPITAIATWNPVDISGNKPLVGKLRNIMAVNAGVVSLVTKAGTPDIANSSSFVIPSVGNLFYGQVAMPVVAFNGRATAGLISSNLRATYSAFGAKSVQSSITELTVAVYSTDSTFNNSTFTNNLTANNVINCGGMPFVQYMTLDNSNNTLVLETNAKTKNAAFVIVENIGSVNAFVTAPAMTNGTSATSRTIPAGGESVFSRDFHASVITFKYLYSKSTA